MPELRYDGRVAIVTGAGAGLGREYALLLASRGAKVVVNDLGGSIKGDGSSNRAADTVVEEIKRNGGTAVANYDSVTDGDKIVKTAMENFGRIDILINNAGILRDRSFPRISEEDWDIIQNVHLKGSFKTTQAAWPIFKKQNFGRIIMTSSNSGVYGNFGQANYAAAKMALIGLSNNLAIEGGKNNIHCNVIVPTAASRLTEGILPEILFNELKPKLIAPVVAYLCHESNEDNGSIIESAAGWATKIHTVRGTGSVLRSSINDDVTIEYVQNVWDKITDMSKAAHLDSIAEASGSLVQVLEDLKSGGVDSNNNKGEVSSTFNFCAKDLMLYALGVGASVSDPDDLKFLYENHPDFCGLPSFFIQPGLLLSMQTSMVADSLKHTSVDLTKILHGEQYIEILDEMPTDGCLETTGSVIDCLDKKSGAVVVSNYDSYANGRHVIRTQSSVFVVGAGGFGGKREPNSSVIPAVAVPTRKPDASLTYKTSVDQAALYRLSGDYNPMHIDPSFAAIAGFKIPILHGLCTLGFSVRAVLKQFANNDPAQFKAMKVRFVKPVTPGQTLKIDMWRNGNRIHFKTSAVETGNDVLSGAYIDLKMVSGNMTNSGLQSDAVFERIKDRVAEDPAKAKTVNAVFLYKITQNGKVTKEWTLDLKNAKVYTGAPDGVKADTTLTVADSDMLDISLGKLAPQAAFMKGKLKITGNIMLTQKLVPLLKTEAKL